MAKYLIEGCCDGSLFSETIEAASQEEAEALAIARLCEAWGEDPADVQSLDDLGDAASVTEYGPDDYARDEAPAMVEALRDLVARDYGQPAGVTVPALDNARAILARIDGAAPTDGTGTATGGIEAPTYDTESEGPTIHYDLRGGMICPPGSVLTDTGTGIVLPDGRILKLWESFELHSGDEARDLSYDDLRALGVHYDGDMARFEVEGEG